MAWADADNDGDLDLFLAGYNSADKMYHNNGDGTFADVTAAANVGDTGKGKGAAWVDFDGDGDLDLYVVKDNQANVLYKSSVGVAFPTLVVQPLTSNGAQSIFTAVKLETSGNTIVALRTLDGGSGYGAQAG